MDIHTVLNNNENLSLLVRELRTQIKIVLSNLENKEK
jgi:hypothetical protein